MNKYWIQSCYVITHKVNLSNSRTDEKIMLNRSYLSLGFSQSYSETEVWVQVVYLSDDPKVLDKNVLTQN